MKNGTSYTRIFSTLNRVFFFLDKKERLVGVGLLLLMAVGAAFESASVGLVIPVIQLMSDPSVLEKSQKAKWVYDFFQFGSIKSFFTFLCIAILVTYFVKNLYLIFMAVVQSNLIRLKKIQLTQKLFQSYLNAPYEFHVQKNPAELFRNVNYVSRFTDGVCMSLITAISEMLVVVVLLSLLLVINPKTTLIALTLLGTATSLFYLLVNKKIGNWAFEQTNHNLQATKWINQAFGGIKEIKVFGKEKFFIRNYIQHFKSLSSLTERIYILNQIPRLYIEVLLITGLISVVIFAVQTDIPLANFLSTIALFGVAAYRLSPSLNRILISAMNLRESLVVIDILQNSLQEIDTLSRKPLLDAARGSNEARFTFRDKLELKNLSFSYKEREKAVLDNFSMKIERGKSVALVGHSGSGKSTIVDLILGLLHPSSGQITVDGRDIEENLKGWQKSVGYVPQQIFLSDDTVEKNIAFGVAAEKIDQGKLLEVIKTCQLEGLVSRLSQGLQTKVGDRGIRLSGGERQRMGLARALYQDPEVLILDEATSALDNETEKEITSAIERLRGIKTLIIVAHRLSTVAKCDNLLFLKDGKVVAAGAYSQLIADSEEFVQFAN